MATGTLIDVNTEDGTLLAKIVDETEDTYSIRYLSPIKRKYNGTIMYDYEESPDEIEKGCVSGFYDTCDESVAGYLKIEGGGFIIDGDNSDDEYDPETDNDQESNADDESLCDSDEDESDSEENVQEE